MAFPLSFRLLAAPLWGLAALRSWIVEWGDPVLTLRVDARHPLPPARVLQAIAESPDVRGLRLQLGNVHAGLASLSAVRRALGELRRQGKLVVVELEHAGNAELYLASASGRVLLRPERPVWLLGLRVVMRFWADLLARFGLQVDVEAVGEFKSFGEAWSRRFPTEANRSAMRALVEDLERSFEAGLAEGRALEPEVVRALVAAGPMSAEAAVEARLADGLRYADAVRTELEEHCGGELHEREFGRWYTAHRLTRRLRGWIARDPVVVVLELEGPVVDGDPPPGAPVIAELPVLRVLDALAEAPEVRGVVLHIRSPGGSAAASDAIWRGVRRLGESKPVVAALGDVAASGGYYIAVGAAEIVAEATSITGSIGVVAARPVLRGAMERFGVHTETIAAAPMADFFTEADWSPGQRARFRSLIEAMYRVFVERVATGRRRAYDQIEPLARGRVWTGAQALDQGLIDAIGGVDEAVTRVARLASLVKPRRVDLEIPRGNRLTRWVRSMLGVAAPELRWLPGPEARLLLESSGQPLYLWATPFELE